MLKTKKIILVFIPAIFLLGIIFTIQLIKYEPLYPKNNNDEGQNSEEGLIPLFPDDPIIGNKKAPITIIGFEDFGCPACKINLEVIDELIKKYPKNIKFVWKGLAVNRFPYSSEKAQSYAYCANQQGFFAEFKKFAFANNENLSEGILKTIVSQIDGLDKNKFNECLESDTLDTYFKNTELLAKVLNIQSVPTIFVNNKQIEPPGILEGWETFLKLNN